MFHFDPSTHFSHGYQAKRQISERKNKLDREGYGSECNLLKQQVRPKLSRSATYQDGHFGSSTQVRGMERTINDAR